MIGRTLGHYRILEKIGAGGMGEVYRAHDDRLDRDVAVKVLCPGLLADEGARQRFRKEALLLAKLTHPDIASVHDFGTDEGSDFLVMEYIAGATLSEELSSGPLPEKEVVRLAAQLVEGLAAAHAQRVVHRDLKPGNLRITPDRRLKILDFGLAKLLRPEAASNLSATMTEASTVVGTLPYMAPEQLRGQPVEERTDIYALGVILYEMATGRRPFLHQVPTALAADIQHKIPTPPSRVNRDLAPRFEELILKCMEKEPANRYQSAIEVAGDLRSLASTPEEIAPMRVLKPRNGRFWAWGAAGAVAVAAVTFVLLDLAGWRGQPAGGGTTHAIQSVAVLPLRNLSGDSAQEYFADGMTEALIENLSKVRALRVISRTSVMQFKRSEALLPEIAQKLGVDAVVEGSVMRSGGRVRISAQLVRAQPEAQIWASSYDRDLNDVLALQSDVARAVAGEIRIRLSSQEDARIGGDRTIRPEVYEAYLRGRSHLFGFNTDDGAKSIAFFREAIRLDGSYAPAYAALASAHINSVFAGQTAPREVFAQARAAAAKALELDDSLAEAHLTMGWVRAVADWDWGEAEREFRRALALAPSSGDGHQFYSVFLSAMGRHEQAIAEATTARNLDPLSPTVETNMAWRYQAAREFDMAVLHYRKLIEMLPNPVLARQGLAEAYLFQGKKEQALAEMGAVSELFDAIPALLPFAAAVYAGAGKEAEARRMLDRINSMRSEVYVPAVRLAMVYAYLGENERALAELERGYEERDAWMLFLKAGSPAEPLRSVPGYQDFLRRLHFPP